MRPSIRVQPGALGCGAQAAVADTLPSDSPLYADEVRHHLGAFDPISPADRCGDRATVSNALLKAAIAFLDRPDPARPLAKASARYSPGVPPLNPNEIAALPARRAPLRTS